MMMALETGILSLCSLFLSSLILPWACQDTHVAECWFVALGPERGGMFCTTHMLTAFYRLDLWKCHLLGKLVPYIGFRFDFNCREPPLGGIEQLTLFSFSLLELMVKSPSLWHTENSAFQSMHFVPAGVSVLYAFLLKTKQPFNSWDKNRLQCVSSAQSKRRLVGHCHRTLELLLCCKSLKESNRWQLWVIRFQDQIHSEHTPATLHMETQLPPHEFARLCAVDLPYSKGSLNK